MIAVLEPVSDRRNEATGLAAGVERHPELTAAISTLWAFARRLSDGAQEDSLVEHLALRETIASLPEKEKSVIALRFYRCLTQESTAHVLGVSQVQVARLEKKAVQHLREMLME